MTSAESAKHPIFVAHSPHCTIQQTIDAFAFSEGRAIESIKPGVWRFVDGNYCYGVTMFSVGNGFVFGVYRDFDEEPLGKVQM